MRVALGALTAGCLALACAGRSETSIDASTGGNGGAGSGAVAGAGAGGNTSGSSGGTSSSTGGTGGSTGSGGSTTGSGGSTTGSGGSTTGSGGSAGEEPNPTPRACNSSDGSGCEEDEICLDTLADDCAPSTSEGCSGYCASKVPHSNCEGGVVACTGNVTCPAEPVECPEGLVNSIVDECWGPCVPADCCACSSELDCQLLDVSCDLLSGRCVVPAAPEPRCFLPFDPGPCLGSARVYAFIDGRCQEQIWGLCEGNDNRFYTLEECLRRCEGLPQQGECPEGRVARRVCLACGPLGGCAETATVCAKACDTIDGCDQGLGCLNGACSVAGCF